MQNQSQLQSTPNLRFNEFCDSWEKKTLKELLTFKNGINASKEKYGKGYKFINVLDIIGNNYITYEKIKGSVDLSESEFNNNRVSYGDVLFQRSSETREEVGQATVYLDYNKDATFGGFVIMGKKHADFSPMFMNYLLRKQSVRKDITTRSGGSTRYNIGQASLEKVTINLPSLLEQEKISSFLSLIDEWIENLKHQNEALKKYKKGMMQKIFSQQVRFKDDNGKEFPKWEEKN